MSVNAHYLIIQILYMYAASYIPFTLNLVDGVRDFQRDRSRLQPKPLKTPSLPFTRVKWPSHLSIKT